MNTMIENLKTQIQPIAKKYNIKQIILYGSRARNDYNENSDYDLYIPDANFKGLIQLLLFKEEIEKEINGNVDISTISKKELDDYLKEEIEKDGIIIYQHSSECKPNRA